MENKVKINPAFIEELNAFEFIPKHYLDKAPSPIPPEKIWEYLDEYIIRHMFICCPFKATPEQKEEYASNSDACEYLKNAIISLQYHGTFALDRYGFVAIIKIDWDNKDKHERLKISWVRKF